MTTARPSRVPRLRGERPPPDWDLVYRRNSLERLKRDQPPVRVRAELPELVARGYEDVAEEDMVRLHWWGLAHDKPKTGTFMVRVKVPGGQLCAAEVRGLGRVAQDFGRDALELTTRQGVQLHHVPMTRLEEVLAAVEAIGLTTAGAEGDTIRNVTSCPLAGLAPDELFDVGPVLRRVSQHFSAHPRFMNLPRKHKYTVSACPSQCNAPEIADVALVAVVKDGRRGFAVRVGGGMSNTPRISQDLGVFVPEDDVVEVLEAVTDAWQIDLRYRVSRAKARIKFFMDDHGPAGVRARVEAQLGRPLEDGAAPVAAPPVDHLGVHPQRDPAFVSIGVPVASGRVTGTFLVQLADLLDDLGADLRLTRQQNVVLGSVPVVRREEATAALAGLGLPVDRSRAVGRSVACTAHRFCNYSVAETKGKLGEVLGRLTERYGDEPVGDLAIHLDGCPHACAQHWIGDIGLQGTTTRVEGVEDRVQAYDVTVGGGLGARTAIGRRLLRRVPTGEVDAVVDRLVGAWLAAREETGDPALPFPVFCDSRTDEELVALATGREHGAGEDQPGVVVALPGPLLELVGGEDRIRVEAWTVGEALAAVTRRFPGFGTTVLPDGQVASAFLVALGEDDIRDLEDLATPVSPGDEITLVMAMAGG